MRILRSLRTPWSWHCIAKLAFVWLVVAASVAHAYPTRAVRLIVPFPPGGSSDILGREFAHHLGVALNIPIVVENRGGANGLIGSKALTAASPDGHTLLFHILTSHIANAAVHEHLPYDVLKDFASISLIGSAGLVYVAHPSFAANNMDELIRLAKTSPGGISVASFGTGSMAHLSIATLVTLAKAKMSHIPYTGSGPAVLATVAGHVPVSVVGLPAALPYIRSGRLRPLAVTSAKRSAQLPDVPAVGETTGLTGYNEPVMYALLAPARTPARVIRRANEATVSVLRSPSPQARLKALGIDDVVGSTPEEMDLYIRYELNRFGQLVRSSGKLPE